MVVVRVANVVKDAVGLHVVRAAQLGQGGPDLLVAEQGSQARALYELVDYALMVIDSL